MAAALTGSVRIIVMDLVDSRLQLAKELGATDVVNSKETDAGEALAELTGGFGVTHAIDAPGTPACLVRRSRRWPRWASWD